jgi:sulfur carrier protein
VAISFRHAAISSTLPDVTITLNGEPHELPGPLTVTELLTRLSIDPRRVAIELNLVIVKRASYDTTPVGAGDHVEIVNFVGGGGPESGCRTQQAG